MMRGQRIAEIGSHAIFAELTAVKRPDLFTELHKEAFRLGAVGPDTSLFMFDPAKNDPDLRKGMGTALEVLDPVQRLKEELQRIADELTKPVDDTADWLSVGLTKELKYTVNISLKTTFLATKLGVGLTLNSITIRNPIFSNFAKLPANFIKNPAHACGQGDRSHMHARHS